MNILIKAIMEGRLGPIEDILASDASISQVRSVTGANPLHLVGIHMPEYAPTLIPRLVKQGADINQVDDLGRTPLIMLLDDLNHPREEVVEALLAAGARVDAVNREGSSALSLLLWKVSLSGQQHEVDEEQQAILQHLVKAGMDINTAVVGESLPLIWSATYQPAWIPPLLAAGALPNLRDADQATPLIALACFYDRDTQNKDRELVCVKALDALMASGAEWAARGPDNKTAWDVVQASTRCPPERAGYQAWLAHHRHQDFECILPAAQGVSSSRPRL